MFANTFITHHTEATKMYHVNAYKRNTRIYSPSLRQKPCNPFYQKKFAYRLQANENERNTQNVDFLCYKSSKKCCHLLFFKKKSQIRFYCEKERNQMLFEANFISLMNDNVTLSTHMK